MIAILDLRFVPKYPSRYGELAVAAERMEEQGTEAVEGNGREAYAEDALLAPLEVQASDVVVAG